MEITEDRTYKHSSGFFKGDKGYYGNIHDDWHSIIVIGENSTHLHLIFLHSGDYMAVVKSREYLKDVHITREIFLGNFIKPREKRK